MRGGGGYVVFHFEKLEWVMSLLNRGNASLDMTVQFMNLEIL